MKLQEIREKIKPGKSETLQQFQEQSCPEGSK